ncbi:hypothetical protein JVT61DRAFT_2940 [Boletus reticuloceps]|uniref:DUF1771 domain-containing protein n=1 Tax=Boletus reticuloceps TaxID=495285 RepID=A0A8I2YM79_9AGAM|nr:hypothetical protein JVT61DRAFT_2940 [Boletus reticuloceps]
MNPPNHQFTVHRVVVLKRYESSRTYESSQPPVHRRDERQQRQSIDSSQRDHITPKEAYASLRARAKQEGDLKSQCYQQSKKAKRRNHARAKALSDKGKCHERKAEMLNAKASATIFKGKFVSISFMDE